MLHDSADVDLLPACAFQDVHLNLERKASAWGGKARQRPAAAPCFLPDAARCVLIITSVSDRGSHLPVWLCAAHGRNGHAQEPRAIALFAVNLTSHFKPCPCGTRGSAVAVGRPATLGSRSAFLGQPGYLAAGFGKPRCSQGRRASVRKAQGAATTWGRTSSTRRRLSAGTRCARTWDGLLSGKR